MKHEIIISGFGGQGVLSVGQTLAYAGMAEGRHVTWLPSYGPEVRGGTANCHVIISDEPIASPLVTRATAVLVMNRPSLERYESSVIPGGALFVNSSLIDVKAGRKDIDVYYVPVVEAARELNNEKLANMVLLGAFMAITGAVGPESVLSAIGKVLGPGKEHLIPANRAALIKGEGIARKG